MGSNNPSNIYLQCLIGMQCDGFTIVAADQTNILSIIVMRDDEEKLHDISDKLVMGVIGDPGDASRFAQFVTRNAHLYKIKNGYSLDMNAIVHFTRRTLATTLKNGTPTMVNMLLAGYNEKSGGELYTLDFLASCVKVPFAVHGFGGLLVLGLLDKHYRPTLTEAEAYEIIKLCVEEIHERLFVNLRNFQVKIISRDGIKEMPCINNNNNTQTFLRI